MLCCHVVVLHAWLVCVVIAPLEQPAMARPRIQALLDAYPTLEQPAMASQSGVDDQNGQPYPLLQMIRYINEMFSINHSKIVEQGQTISKLKAIVEANGHTIFELKAEVANLVGPTPPASPPSQAQPKAKAM